jgi:hypothetical protein
MTLQEIRECPTVVNRCHESVLRSFHILDKIKHLLANGVPASCILEIVEDLESAPGREITA